MSSQISFIDDDGEDDLTFVNYGSGSDYTYRHEARIHNAKRGLRKTRRAQNTAPDARGQPHAQRRGLGAQSQPAASTVASSTTNAESVPPLVPESSLYDFNSLPQSLEEVWRSKFPEYFYLPRLSAPSTTILDPEDAFLTAARSSQYAYRNLVTLTAINAEAKRGATTPEHVFRNQAQIIQEFRAMVQRHTTQRTRLTRQQLQDIFIAAFSFFGRDFGREPAYNAIIFVNSTVMFLPENRTTRLPPVAEWIRLLLPRPGDSFNRTQIYQSTMLKKANAILDFLETTQHNFQNRLTTPFATYFHPSTATYQLLTTKSLTQPTHEPFPDFHQMCLHSILFLLHTHLNHLTTLPANPNPDPFLTTLESTASECLTHPAPYRTTLFLWSILVTSESQNTLAEPQEQCYVWSMKDLAAMHGLEFVQRMIQWLPGVAGRDVPEWLDVAALRETMSGHYEPDGPPDEEEMEEGEFVELGVEGGV